MLNIVVAVLVYECFVALAFILCWRLVRGVDTRLPIASAAVGETIPRFGLLPSGAEHRQPPALHWQITTFILGAMVLGGVALAAAGVLSDLRSSLIAADSLSPALQANPILLRLVLPVGHLAVLLLLYFLLRQSVLFPAVVVHLFLIAFCLLVTVLDPGRAGTVRLTLVPIFTTNLVLLIVTHGLLTLLFCRSKGELAVAVLLAGVAGGILALGTMVISLVSTLLGGPLFFFQLYLVSAFGIFGLYFCVASIILTLRVRD